ncbi:cyclic nucleotide-binding domain-containing protein [Algirhabdus cladophorae]|uniref:cyclic nucleotide-binding domain-containing protein n=1 Tax=Algirhabdus cladophorae TaxID=3377108 RepID=UPI003B84981E
MDFSYFFSTGVFVQLALLCYVLGLLTRNELMLRLLVLIGTVFYIIYYYFVSDTPLWDAIWASLVIGAANLFVIGIILMERTTYGMSPQMVALYQHFPTLNPGQFRKIMKRASWTTADQPIQISRKGGTLDHLFLIASGNAILRRNGLESVIPEGNFVGEISFLIEGPASADVIVPQGTTFVQWNRQKLKAQMRSAPQLSNALSALFNKDIARKLAVSTPDITPQSAPFSNQTPDQ